MVDIADKSSTARRALAAGRIVMQAETLDLIRQGKHRKGDVLGVARIAGIMATKRTADLVPMCHPLTLTHVNLGVGGRPPTHLDAKLSHRGRGIHCGFGD